MSKVPAVAAIAAAMLVAAVPHVGAQGSATHRTLLSERASSVGVRLVRIEARAGSLRVEGRLGNPEIYAAGTARASSRELLERIKLKTERHGDVVDVIVEIPEAEGYDDDHEYAALDLTVELPETIALDVVDGSGDLEIKNVGPLELVDGSGEATIDRVRGRLRVRDGSGELRIQDVRGDVQLEDGSGGIRLRTIGGSVTVTRDGSGEIEAVDVTGSVRIQSKGSGSVEVERVGGDFVVDRKGTGSIQFRDVKGRVTIPERRRPRY